MASRGKTVQKSHMFVADFETCDTRPALHAKDYPLQKVWIAGMQNIESKEKTRFNSLDDFMAAALARRDNQNIEIAMHNLKFDGSFIVPWLLRNGYHSSHNKPKKGEFSVLIDDKNNWYSVQVQVSQRRRVTIWDSAKLFPMPLEYLPGLYGTPTQKVIEDGDFYNQIRPDGHEATEREILYFDNDLQVLTEAIEAHIDICGIQFKKTQAAQAFWEFEQSFKAWKFRFPGLSVELDQYARAAYWGGIAHVNELHRAKDMGASGVFDINSSYPDKAANCKLPYGPVLFEGGEGHAPDMSKFWIAEALVQFTLKPGKLPCIPTKAISEGRPYIIDKWLDDSDGIVKMTFCCIDYLTMLESYDLKIWRWMSTAHWAWKVQKEIQKFVLKNNTVKVENKELAAIETDRVKRQHLLNLSQRAKINNNAFYGKFGEEIVKYGKTAYLQDDDIVYIMDREDEQSERKRKFLPVAIAITAWGRRQLVQMANILGDDFVYCDTDSIHYRLETGQAKIDQAIKDGIFEVNPTKLGAWKFEGSFIFGRYLRAKCYMEEKADGELEITLAGLPADKHSGMFSKKRSCLTKDNFHIGYTIPAEQANKLRSVRTQTGIKLVPVAFQIKEKVSLLF